MIAVVSAAPGDGKGTVASNLALAAAGVGERVLILEADFRRPLAARMFGVNASPGIADILLQRLPLQEAVQTARITLGPDQAHEVSGNRE